MNYVKIPKEIIYDKKMLDKRVLIFSYLYSRRTLDDTVAFSISELCRWSQVKLNRNKGKINDKYINTLHDLCNKGYIDKETFPDLTSGNQYSYHLLNINSQKFDVEKYFANIYFDELQKIINFKEILKDSDITLDRMSAAYILLLLSYLRLNMYRGTDKPQCCYRYYQTISEEIGISERYVTRIVEILDLLKIIKTVENKRIRFLKDNNELGFCTSVKIFADYRHFVKTSRGQYVIDNDYSAEKEIKKQLLLFNQNRE